jgi:hypothetical protein
MKLNSKDFEYEDIWTVLQLVDTENDYRCDTVGGVEYHSFEVHYGTEVEWGDETVEVAAGIHQLLLDAYSREWIGYVKQT